MRSASCTRCPCRSGCPCSAPACRGVLIRRTVTGRRRATILVTRRGGTANLSWIIRIALGSWDLLWWYGAIAIGLVVGDISPMPAVLFWIGIWVVLPIVAALAGNPWPSLIRSARPPPQSRGSRGPDQRLDAGLPYPAGLARWPAVVLFAAGLWSELILPNGSVAATVAALVADTRDHPGRDGAFGPVAWLRHAELFEVHLGWLGALGRADDERCAGLCDGSGQACYPVAPDCPECAAAAEDGERRAGGCAGGPTG